MNILILDSWLRDYLKTDATPQNIKDCLSLCGPSIERINKLNNDYIYDIEITSNRVDMASVYGIAREAAAILPNFGFKTKLIEFNIQNVKSPNKMLPLKIIDNNHLCKRVLGVVLEVDLPKTSSEIIKLRLESSGVRSLNNLVDITNYIMLEIGQPCHVFDYDRIKTHELIIRNAKTNEEIITLDYKKYKLNSEDVIIDDGTGRVIDLPGIMGTENSIVTNETKRILFFIESNNPMSIRKSSMRYAIRTMAATINEKNLDPDLSKTALLYGINLYEKLANGKTVSEIIDIYPKKTEIKPIKVNVSFINKHLGITLKINEIINILKSLNFTVASTGNILTVTPPSYRQYDVLIPVDIVEEVARIYGYHKLPNNLMDGHIPDANKSKTFMVEEKIKLLFKYTGLTETYSYSMLSEDLLKKADIKTESLIKITNALTEDLKYMRTSLIPQMLANLSANQNISTTLSLFELSKIYLIKPDDLPEEKSMLCIGLANKSFLELKGYVELMLTELGINEIQYKPLQDDYLVLKKNQSAQIIHHDTVLGYLGAVKNNILNNFNNTNNIVVADLDFDKIVELSNSSKTYIQFSLFPPLIQDLALVIDTNIYIQHVLDEIQKVDRMINKAFLFDSYENTKTIRIIYQNTSKTLTEEDVKPIRVKILTMMKEKFQAVLKQ